MEEKDLYGDDAINPYENIPDDISPPHFEENYPGNQDFGSPLYSEPSNIDEEYINEEVDNSKLSNNISLDENLSNSQEILAQTLPEAFSLLNKMLEEAQKSSANIETMYETTNVIKGIITELNQSITTFAEIGEIVEHLNKVKMVLNINNQNLEKLITVLNKVVSKQENIETELQDMKYESNDEVEETQEENKTSNSDIVLYIAVGLNLILTLFIGVKIGF